MTRLYDRAFLMAVLSQTGFVLANSMTFHYARWIGFLVAAIYLVSCIPVWLSRRRPVAVSDPPTTRDPPPER